MEEEIFRESSVFPENYLVSNKGRVITKKTGLSRKFRTTWDGYYDVGLWKKGKKKTIRVHRLIAEAFVPNPKGLKIINHIDGNKKNNHVNNLEWSTVRDNTRHSYLNGLQKSLKGDEHGRSKFTNEQIVQVCELLDKKTPRKEIAKITGVSVRTIQSISSGVNWVHISKDYDFFTKRSEGNYSENDKIKVCNLLEEGISIPQVAKETGVPVRIIQNVDRGYYWTDISSEYKFYRNKQH